MQLEKLQTDSWEERANKVLSRFCYTYPDEIDMHEICWKYGMKIKPLDPNYMSKALWEAIKHLKAYSVPTEGRRGLIYLKPELDYIEKKLLLAEEFCHLYAHYQAQLDADPVCVAKTENQAKRMSAYLLMPSKFIRHIYEAAMDEAVLISDIADYFVVPEEFVHYRMELIYNRHVDAIWNVGGKLGTVQWIE